MNPGKLASCKIGFLENCGELKLTSLWSFLILEKNVAIIDYKEFLALDDLTKTG